MTMSTESVIPPRMGRKKLWHQRTAVKFPQGTFERIAAVLQKPKEVRMDFIRKAVERELRFREAKHRPKKPRH